MILKNPPHPGLAVRHDCLEPFELSVTKGAEVLGVTRQALNNLVNGKAGISPEMAVRLAKAFGSTAETWLGMQTDYDLAQVRKHEGNIKVKRVKPLVQDASPFDRR
jgi:addiction module HigA family antidote